MNYYLRQSAFNLLVLLIIESSPLFAQVDTGTPPFSTVQNVGIEAINLANLNDQLAFQIFSKPGRGMPFTYTLTYDTSVWTPPSMNGTQSWQPVQNWGWRGVTEIETGYVSYTVNVRTCNLGTRTDPLIYAYNRYAFNGYHDSFGVLHRFNAVVVDDNTTCGNTSDVLSATATATDGSGYTFAVDSAPSAVVYPRSGGSFRPPLNTGIGSGTATDPNGNQISTPGNGVFTDTLGTTALTVSSGAPNPLTFTYPTLVNGVAGSASVTVNYTPYTIQTWFQAPGIGEYGPTTVYLVDSIVYPDNSRYSFTYENTPAGANCTGCKTGRLATITLRTGGTITYAYTGGNNGINPDGSAAGLTRTTSDGATTYQRVQYGNIWETIVTDPANHNTVYDFSGIYETQRRLWQGAIAGTPYRRTFSCYNGNWSTCETATVTAPITSKTTWTLLEAGQQLSAISEGYTGSGLLTGRWEYDCCNMLRNTNISYAALGNIVDRPSQVTVYDGANPPNQIAQTTYYYDQVAPSPTAGIPQHVAVSGSRGNLTTVARWLNTTGGTLNTTFAYDDTSQVTSTTDPGGHTTSFAYGNANAYVTQVTMPNTGVAHTTGANYDSNTGLMTSSTDQNGKVTSFSYDSMLRPVLTTFPDGGQTNIEYHPEWNQNWIRTKIDVSKTQDLRIHYDSYGRQDRTALYSGNPTNNWDQQDTCFNNLGQVSFQSYSYQGQGWGSPKVCAGRGDTSNYDALGRPLSVTHSDGSSVQYAYAGRATQITEEGNGTSRPSRILQSDALGRITNVCEVYTGNPLLGGGGAATSCGLDIGNSFGFLTSYSYDLLDNLKTATQGSLVSRNFNYDSLSRLTSESSPETSGSATSYTYNADGLLYQRTRPAPNQTNPAITLTTTYAYDQLHRSTDVQYSDSTPAIHNNYDAGSIWGVSPQNPIGRLVTSERTGVSGTGRVYSYDSMGRVQNNWQCVPRVCSYLLSYGYDSAGDLISSTNGVGVTLSYTYNVAGRLAGMTSSLVDPQHPATLISGIKYNGFGHSISANLGNGLAEHTSYDIDGQLRAHWLSGSSTSPISLDLGVWTPSTATFTDVAPSIPGSQGTQQLGQNGDIPVPGDYDGDGKTDYAVWRPSNGTWYVIPSSNPNTMITQGWGVNGDKPVPGDYDGDGKTDFAFWRPSDGHWYIYGIRDQPWGGGWVGDIPVPGDYDGDGRTDIAVWRPSEGNWYIIPSSTWSWYVTQWGGGWVGDVPVQADFDGDGKTDIAVWRAAENNWYIRPSNGSAPYAIAWGGSADVPVPADYDGDGQADITIWRPSTGVWWIRSTAGGGTTVTQQFGTSGDQPLPAHYGAGNLYNFGLGYAPDGTILRASDSVGGRWSFNYDQLNRLANSNKNNGQQTFSYEYDRYGNRWHQNAPQGGPAPQYTFDVNNHINNVEAHVSYDALGNVTNDGFHSYTYDAENRLISTDNYGYVYDAEGRRIRGPWGDYLYDLEGHAIAVLNLASGNPDYEEVYAGGRHLATYSGGTTNFIHTDWLGQKKMMTGVNGVSSETCSWLPFGDGRNCTGTNWSFNDFGDYLHDFESNLEHTWFRQYTSTQGRWLTPDPYAGSMDLTNPQSLNRYAYVVNSPMNHIDSKGLNPCDRDNGFCDEDDGGNAGGGCVIDGVVVSPCPTQLVGSLLSSGSAVRCPYANCDPIYSRGQWWFFGAWADGSSGYTPGGFAGFSAADLASLRLEPVFDCSHKGERLIEYSLHGRAGLDTSRIFVTEHQDPPYWALGPAGNGTTTDSGGMFEDYIFGSRQGRSEQNFTISLANPQKNPKAVSIPVIVRLPMPGGLTDYGTLAINHGGTHGYMYIQGNSSGFIPETANGDCRIN